MKERHIKQDGQYKYATVSGKTIHNSAIWELKETPSSGWDPTVATHVTDAAWGKALQTTLSSNGCPSRGQGWHYNVWRKSIFISLYRTQEYLLAAGRRQNLNTSCDGSCMYNFSKSVQEDYQGTGYALGTVKCSSAPHYSSLYDSRNDPLCMWQVHVTETDTYTLWLWKPWMLCLSE